MSSQAQIDANRRNSQKSTGPRTPEGRAAVRLNGVKHGLCAETLVLEGESKSDFDTLFDSLEAEHRPATPTEQLLLSQFALSSWRLRRTCHTEASFFTLRYVELKDESEKIYTDLRPSDHHSITFQKDSAGPDTLAKFHRHEARLERSMYRALHELQRLQAQRLKSESLQAALPAPKKEITKQTQSAPAKPSVPEPRPAATPQQINEILPCTPNSDPLLPADPLSPVAKLKIA